MFVRFVLSGTFKTTRTSPVNNELKQQVTVPVKTSRTKKLRVARLGLSNTRPVRINTADRAPNMSTRRIHVGVLVCKVFIEWNIRNNPYQPSEERVEIYFVPEVPVHLYRYSIFQVFYMYILGTRTVKYIHGYPHTYMYVCVVCIQYVLHVPVVHVRRYVHVCTNVYVVCRLVS